LAKDNIKRVMPEGVFPLKNFNEKRGERGPEGEKEKRKEGPEEGEYFHKTLNKGKRGDSLKDFVRRLQT